jgi:hypothetical protein
MAEKDLSILLSSINPQLHDGEFVFCTLPEQTYKGLSINPLCFFREEEGISIVIEKAQAENLGLQYTGTWSLITCKINSSLEAVGFLASMSATLAKEDIPANAISAYFHDHLFVPSAKAKQALGLLQELSTRLTK